MSKFHVGFVGPCRDGVMAEVIAIELRAEKYMQLVYLRAGVVDSASLDGRWGALDESGRDLLPPAPKMVTRWLAVGPASGYATKKQAEQVFGNVIGNAMHFTIVPFEVEVP